MIKEELEKKLDSSFEFMEKTIADVGSFTPMLEVVFRNKEGELRSTMMVLMGDMAEKRQKIAEVSGVIFGVLKNCDLIENIEGVILMTESWTSEQIAIRPSLDPKRKEVLMASGQTLDGLTGMRSKEMRSVEVKGKRYFTLHDIPSHQGKDVDLKSPLFDGFFNKYNGMIANKTIHPSAARYKELGLEVALREAFTAAAKFVGGRTEVHKFGGQK